MENKIDLQLKKVIDNTDWLYQLLKSIFYISVYFILIVVAIRNDRYFYYQSVDPSSQIFLETYATYSTYIIERSRVLSYALLQFSIAEPAISFYVYVLFFAIDIYLLQLLLIKWHVKEARFYAFVFFFVIIINYTFTGYYIGILPWESIGLCGMYSSLLLYENDYRKTAFLLQFICVFLKEYYSAIFFIYYFIDHSNSIKELWQSIKDKIRIRRSLVNKKDNEKQFNFIIICLVTISYALVRLYFWVIDTPLNNPSNASNPIFGSGTLAELIGITPMPMESLSFVIFRTIFILNVLWIFVLCLFQKRNRQYLYLFLIQFMLILLFGDIQEVSKWVITFPFIIYCFQLTIDSFKQDWYPYLKKNIFSNIFIF